MGNNSAKKCASEGTCKAAEDVFSLIAKNKTYIDPKDLKIFWGNRLHQDVYKEIEIYLLNKCTKITKEIFIRFYLDICKGPSTQRAEVLTKILGVGNKITGEKLTKFITGIIKSSLMIQGEVVPKKYHSWSSKSTFPKDDSFKKLSFYFLSQTKHKQETETEDIYETEDLMYILTEFEIFLQLVFLQLYSMKETFINMVLMPEWIYDSFTKEKTLQEVSILDMVQIMFLNMHVPIDNQNEWKLLFNSKVDGESFSRLTQQIINKGSTLIIVVDKEGYIFGGYASMPWKFSPTFFGDNKCFLFTLHPTVNIYPATNYNFNFQYINTGQHTLPNGLGMGGKLEYFGLWLDAEFGSGYCSESCSTFKSYALMSGQKNFEIDQLEVWNVGSPIGPESEAGERTILNNIEAAALLEMSGKTSYSAGLVEQD